MKKASWADQIINFTENFNLSVGLPKGIQILDPWKKKEAILLVRAFYKKFYQDHEPRSLILGINPGRFGGGQTGIPFTDPVRLREDCGIPNDMLPRSELSSDFMYQMIDEFGGTKVFYRKFYISSVCPVGFIKDGKNLNYYDVPSLRRNVKLHLPEWLDQQMGFGLNKKTCFCLGEGKNYKFFEEMNRQHQWFNEVIPLPHPRFIMQYRRKNLEVYLSDYLRILSRA